MSRNSFATRLASSSRLIASPSFNDLQKNFWRSGVHNRSVNGTAYLRQALLYSAATPTNVEKAASILRPDAIGAALRGVVKSQTGFACLQID